VYDVELVCLICRDINNAKDDPRKEQELISLLQAVIREDQEEMRIRMAFLAKKYAGHQRCEGCGLVCPALH
jgi:hypothetical protein